MSRVFLDCGAHCGCSRKYIEKNIPGVEIYSFEPDPEFNQYCPQLINKAVWIEDCQKTFYKFAIDGGSTLSKTRADLFKVRKPNYYEKQEITVECIDLAKFILDIGEPLYLKLDVEGSEYDIIPHLINTGATKYILDLFIEWHDERAGYTVKDTHNLTLKLNEQNIFPKNWDAMNINCIINQDKNRQQFHKR